MEKTLFLLGEIMSSMTRCNLSIKKKMTHADKCDLFFFFVAAVGFVAILIMIFTQHILGLLLVCAFAFLVLILIDLPANENPTDIEDMKK